MNGPKRNQGYNLFRRARGPNADQARAELAAMAPCGWDELGAWLAALPAVQVLLRSHAVASGLVVFDEERGVFVGRDVAEAQKKFRRLRP